MQQGFPIASLAQLVLLIIGTVVAIYSIIMIYHWHAFGQNKKTVQLMTVLYLSGLVLFGGGVLLGVFGTFSL
jgi:hypothetical protein